MKVSCKRRTGRSWRVAVRSENKGFLVQKQRVKGLVSTVLQTLENDLFSEEVREVSVLFVDDPRIGELNLEYRGKEKPTDVLSFSQLEGAGPSSDFLGDIVISLDRALAQAKERKLTLSEELSRLVIHGLLHLSGFDHEGVTAVEANRMRRLERSLWNRFSADFRRLATVKSRLRMVPARSKTSRK